MFSQPDVARLFARASELDAARSLSTTVPELRAAAAEAGIGEAAFSTALAELQGRVARDRRRRWWFAGSGFAALVVAVALLVMRPWVAPVTAPGVVEEAILLRCLSPGDAAELVRPLLTLPENRVVVNPEHSPRVLTMLVTPEQLERVRQVLNQYEAPGSACPVP